MPVDPSRLAAIPLFADLATSDLDAIAAAASEGEVPEGQPFVTEGEFGFAMFAIESGTAEVSIGETAVRTLGPGDVFGEIAVLSSGRRTATVVATTRLRLIALLNRDVWALERRAPDVAERLRALISDRRDSATD